jgi:pyruvate dehydrogenase E2 component (dihydrolipoamide acetyltransferase)
MPRLSDTMTEGVITQWLKHEGDTVRAGEVLAEIETDKATMELEAYDSGILTQVLVQSGTSVPIGHPIAVIGERSQQATDQARPVTPSPSRSPTPRAEPGAGPPAQPPPLLLSPLARKTAREHGVDLRRITGTGPGGRIVRADVQAAIPAPPSDHAPPGTPGLPATRSEASATAAPDTERVPLSTIRRITAQRLTESAAAPHFYLTAVIDAEALLELRREANTAFAEAGLKISVTDLLIRACAVALRTHPQVNSSWGGDHILRHHQINIGCAVALPDGLIVPVIRAADRKSLSEIATQTHALTERARSGKLTPEEFTGGTFTLSNLGMFGIDHFTAVINPPEAAILAVGASRQEAAVRDGQVVATTTMKLTLSVDHRVLDGATGAAFLRDLTALLEQPLRILV